MRAPERPSNSPLSTIAVAIGSLRHLGRRYRLGRLAAVAFGALIVVLAVQRGDAARIRAEARWSASEAVWVATGPVGAGEQLTAANVQELTAPIALTPAGAVDRDPTGERVRVEIEAGEIIVARRLSSAGSEYAARTPDEWGTISIGRGDELFTVGDLVDLHHVIDGHLLADDAVIIAVTAAGLGVAVPPDRIGDVVRALGQAGVVPVLTG